MVGTIYNSSQVDEDGRSPVLDDRILDVHYYTAASESWDRTGGGTASWYLENFLPNDSFDATGLATDRWSHRGSASVGTATYLQTGGQVEVTLDRDEGVSSITSEGKWRLSGDFDVRLYIDWASYYNEYRSIAHTFLKVGVDDSNAVRLSFTFNGDDGYQLRSDRVVGRDPKFLGWLANGSYVDLSGFSATSQYLFFRITRSAGTIRTYVSDGVTSTQVGGDVSDAALAADVFVEFGVQALQYNTLKAAFTKFFIAEGQLDATREFFSSTRGRTQAFPEKSIIVVDSLSLSVIDEATQKLWMRFTFDEGGPITSNSVRVGACSGTIYCATSTGVVALDFRRDKIFRYSGSSIYVADEPMSLRNAGVVFRTYAAGVGNIPDNNIHDISCRVVGGEEYIAFTNDSGVAVMRALASGVAHSDDGPVPGSRVEISERGSLFWSCYDQPNNDGELSYYSNITALSSPGTNPFSRSGYYGVDTPQSIFGANITSFSVREVAGQDFVAVGTTEGISFISATSASRGFGVSSPTDNPFSDPSFENYLGLDWHPFYTGLLSRFRVRRVSSFVTDGSYALEMMFLEPNVDQVIQAGTTMGVYQDVDLTGVERVYFDVDLETPQTTVNIWDFEFVVGDTVVYSFSDTDGPFTKYNASADVVGFDGVQRVKLQIRATFSHNVVGTDGRVLTIDNIKTKIGEPEYRILPPGNASILEVLLQYDAAGHKIYFSTAEGYGAVDLDDNSLDYFIPLTTHGPTGGEAESSDFTRVIDEP